MSDTVKRALDLVSGYQDPPSKKMQGFDWRPLRDVQEDLGGMQEIPGHVEDFGAYMDEMARKAATSGLSPRDLIKAYAITRSSIQRRSQTADKVRAAGLDLHPSVTGSIRPEGAMAEWLKSKMGQRYLDAAEVGKVDPEAVAHAQKVMKPFGLNAETDALPWAAENLHDKHKAVSDMVKRAVSQDSPVAEWREFGKGLRGIGTAKAGFAASMLGRGDQPTLDARQVVLQTGMPTSEAKGPMARAGFDAVDRLASRQTALNPKMDPGLEPFRQHLTHHAIWDKAGNEQTTHSDVIDAMRHANAGGRVGKAGGGSMDDRERQHHMLIHAMAAAGGNHGLDAMVNPDLVAHMRSGSTQEIVRRALDAAEKGQSYKRTGTGLMQRDPRLMEAPPVLSDIKNNPKSGHLNTPFSQLEAKFAPKGNLMPSKDLDIEQLQRENARLVPLVGDRTPADTLLLGHKGVDLSGHVNQQGGANYTRSEFAQGEDPSGWRSRQVAAGTMQKNVHKLNEDGRPVYGAHVAMGHKSGDSSHMLLHSVIKQVPNLPIKSASVKAFDEEMRNKFPATTQYPMEWPGIMNTQDVHDFFYRQPKVIRGKNGKLDTLIHQPRPGKHVTNFVQNIDSVRWQNAGFPDIASARFANTEPELFAEPQLATGFSLTKLDPSTKRLQPNTEDMQHGTYTHGMPSLGYAGKFPALVQASEIWKENLGAAKTPTAQQHTLMTKFPSANVDQRVVDLVKGAQEERQKKYGFNTGGRVQPTDAQKEAGNYRKEHISFQGLPISIETRKGQTRSGTGPSGHKWSVKLPYDYGYIKRTEGADGDHVDVCIGPDGQSDHVFVVDQHDHRTGKFDEHKVMLGYRTKSEAEHAYMSGFSDGKGKARMKAVVAMPMAQFKQWLKRGNTKSPIERAMSRTSLYSLGHDRDAG